jgi:hypothetical protein
VTFCNKLIFLRRGVVRPTPNPQAGGPPLVRCPRLLVQYIRSYLPYLEVVSSIRNLSTSHTIVTRDTCNMGSHFVFLLTCVLVCLCLSFREHYNQKFCRLHVISSLPFSTHCQHVHLCLKSMKCYYATGKFK